MRQARGLFFVVALCVATPQAIAQALAARPRSDLALVQVVPGERPIRLAHAGVDVVIEGSLVHTVIDLALANPNARVLEGELQFPLHAGQTVTGFSLDMADGSMRAAVPVPKARGREAFENVVRQGVDPALLEQAAGDNFRLRVYPLRPGASRHVRIALTEWLTPGAQRRLRLGLPLDFAGTPVDELDLHVRLQATAPAGVRLGDALAGASVTASGADSDVTLHRSGYRPFADAHRTADLDWPATPGDTVLREQVDGRGYFHAELQVPDLPAPRAVPHDVTLIWDASGSGAQRDHEAELRLLGALFAWAPDVAVRLRVVRDAAEPDRVFDVRRGDWRMLRDALRQVVYDGASNASLWTAPPGRSPARSLALLFSDGLGNWGPPAGADTGNVAAYAVQAGAGGSAAFLQRWAESRGGRLLDLSQLRADDALAWVQRRVTRLVRIDGTGFDQPAVASWVPDAGPLVLAGRFTGATATLDLVLESGDGAPLHKTVSLVAPASSGATDAGLVAQRWARLRVDDLLAQPELHRTEITALGNAFGIVTPETSLIVLEALSDYQRYEIVPPVGPLRDAWDADRRTSASARAARSARHLASLVDRWRAVQAWWDTDFPEDAPAAVEAKRASADPARPAFAADASTTTRSLAMRPPAAVAAAPATASVTGRVAQEPGDAAQRVVVTGAGIGPSTRLAPPKKAAGMASSDIRIAVQAWSPDADATRRLAQAASADRYAVYLDQRMAASNRPAFYLDAAQVFAAHGQRGLAQRVLSNLAELHIEDRGLLRVLAYRLQDIGETDQAIRLLRRVCDIAPDEPQSWRDLGLAQAAAQAWQPAVDALWTAASSAWSDRFGDIDLIALGELDAIAALHTVDVTAVDERLRRNLPLDVRVALSWDTDNTDIDLWVKDPSGEWVSYQNLLSRQGGRNTRDVVQGYGPEVFSLKKALPGRYEVHAKYYGSHRQALGNGTSVMMRLTTGFGTQAEMHRDVIARLEEARDDILVGSFDVK